MSAPGPSQDKSQQPDLAAGASLAGQEALKSQAFRRWFDGSQVLDAAGKPLVVYHGTNVDFAKFEIYPAFFTPDAAAASAYASSDKEPTMDPTLESAGNVIPVFLSVKRPLRMDVHELIDTIGGHREILRPEWANFDDWAFGMVKKGQYDGIHLTGAMDFVGLDEQGELQRQVYDQWIVFGPTQIKSAIGNSGRYDMKNPDITDRIAAAEAARDFMSTLVSARGPHV